MGELRDLFSLVDRNGDGRIDASELTAVAAAVGGMGGDAGGGGGGDGVDDFYVTLLEHARTSFAGEAEEGEAEGEAEAGSGSLDFATFVRLMSSKAVSEYKAAAPRRPSVCRGWRPFRRCERQGAVGEGAGSEIPLPPISRPWTRVRRRHGFRGA